MMSRGLFILFCLIAPTLAQTTAPTTQPDYFAMSPDEFSQCEAANQKLNYDHPDQTLISAGILHETNRWRAKEGLKPLVHHPQVDEAAMMHVKDMVAKNYLAHEEKDTNTPHPMDRVRAARLSPILVAENIGTASGIQYKSGEPVFPLRQWRRDGLSYKEDGPAIPAHTYQTFAAQVVKQWIDSPKHRENIMLPDAKYLGSAALPAIAKGSTEAEFHKFYTGQVFFTPSRFANDRPRERSTGKQQPGRDRRRDSDDDDDQADQHQPVPPDPIGDDPKSSRGN